MGCLTCTFSRLPSHRSPLQGVLNAAGSTTMAQCVFLVFIPALTLSKLALAVSIESIVRFWALLANMTISMVLGLALGVLAAWVLRVPASAQRQVVAAVAFANVGNLPIVASYARE